MIQTMTRINRQYESEQELSEEQKQELQERLNKKIEQSKYFGKPHCPGRERLADGRVKCKYAGNKCVVDTLNSIHYTDPEKDVVFCLLKTRNYTI